MCRTFTLDPTEEFLTQFSNVTLSCATLLLLSKFPGLYCGLLYSDCRVSQEMCLMLAGSFFSFGNTAADSRLLWASKQYMSAMALLYQ